METYQCSEVVSQVMMHKSGSSFLSSEGCHVLVRGEGVISELKAWDLDCGNPLMTFPLGPGFITDYVLAANSDLSCVALYEKSRLNPMKKAGFKVEVWKS